MEALPKNLSSLPVNAEDARRKDKGEWLDLDVQIISNGGYSSDSDISHLKEQGNKMNLSSERQPAAQNSVKNDKDFIIEASSLGPHMGQPSSAKKNQQKRVIFALQLLSEISTRLSPSIQRLVNSLDQLLAFFCLSIFIISMNVIIWNVRGLGNSASLARVKKLVIDHSPYVLAIIEPLMDSSNLMRYCHRLGHDNAHSTTTGKLWLFRKHSSHLSIVSHIDQLIHIAIGGLWRCYCPFHLCL